MCIFAADYSGFYYVYYVIMMNKRTPLVGEQYMVPFI